MAVDSTSSSVHQPDELDGSSHSWTMSGDPWLDGVVYARGALRAPDVVDIKIGKMVQRVAEEAHVRVEDLGWQVELKKRNAAPVELFLRVTAPDPLFDGLPRFRDRRIPSDAPDGFLVGYLQAATEITPRFDALGEVREDAWKAIISPWRPGTDLEDLLDAFERLGIHDPVQHKNRMELAPEAYKGIEVFEALQKAAQEEEEELRAEKRGRSRWDELSQSLLVDKDDDPGPPAVLSVIERRMLLHRLVEGLPQGTHGDEQRIEIPYARYDEVKRGLYWDLMSIHPHRYRKAPGSLSVAPQVATWLLDRYDHVIRQCFPATKEHKTLLEIYETLKAGNGRHYAKTLPRDQSNEFLPEPRPRQALMDIFVDEICPFWFSRQGEESLRLEEHEEIATGIDEESEQAILEWIDQAGPLLLERLGALSFSPDDSPPGKDILGECPSCQERIVLTDGAGCTQCGRPLCLQCEGEDPEKALCASHRVDNGSDRSDLDPPPRTLPKRPTRTQPKVKAKPQVTGKTKEIKVLIDEAHHQALHKKKILTGKTLTQMVDEALEDYLGSEAE